MARKGAGKRAGQGAGQSGRFALRLSAWAHQMSSRLSVRTWLAVVSLAVLAGGFLYARHLTREAYAWEVFTVDPAQGIEVERPAHAPNSWMADLSRAAFRIQQRTRISIFSDQDLAVVREEISRVPWVREVEEIERRFPDRLYVRLVAREPVARVIHEDRVEWVDEEAVLLPPPASDDEEALRRLLLLPGVLATTSPKGVKLPELAVKPPILLYGAAVKDARFRAACATAAQLEDMGLAARLPKWRLVWIDTTGFDPDRDKKAGASELPPPEVRLVFVPAEEPSRSLKDDVVTLRVDWGSPPAHDQFEPARGRDVLSSAELRMQLLENWTRANPDCDRKQEVSVRFGSALGAKTNTASEH